MSLGRTKDSELKLHYINQDQIDHELRLAQAL